MHKKVESSILSSAQEINSIVIQQTLLADLERQAHAKLPKLCSTLEEFWVNIPLSGDWISRALVVRPKPVTVECLNHSRVTDFQKRPLIIHFHGGGFAAGSPIQLSLAARLFAKHLDATVICPAYRLAPEHPWPQAMKDGMELVRLISSDPSYHYGAYPSDGFILAGVSAGACIAGVVAGLTSGDPLSYPLRYPLTGVYLSIAVLLVADIVPPQYKHLWTSHDENIDVTGLTSIAVNAVFTHLKQEDFRSPWFSPVNHFSNTNTDDKDSSRFLSNLAANHPPTYLQAAAQDPLRDDTIIYEKMLRDAGIPTKHHLFRDDGHVSLTTLNLLTGSRSRNPSIKEGTLEGLDWLCKIGLERVQKREELSFPAFYPK